MWARNTIRRAFDVGSGSVKCQVAEVNESESQIHRVLYTNTVPLLSINSKNQIPSEVRKEGLSILQNILKETESLNPSATVGIATQAFRVARNGSDVIEYFTQNTGVPISIIDSKQEARFSYLSALGLRPPSVSNENLVAWDSGAGSFQFSNWISDHFDNHGSATIRSVAEEIIKSDRFQNHALVNQLLNYLHKELLPKPHWFTEMKNPYTIAIGSSQSIFNQCRVLSGKNNFTVEDVETVLSEVVELSSIELEILEQERGVPFGYSTNPGNVPYILPKLSLLLGIMRKFDLHSVDFHQTCGNCVGVLIEPSLWSEKSYSSSKSETISTLLKRLPKERKEMLITANWHLQKTCNYKCSFCYAHFADPSIVNLDETTGKKLLDALQEWGITKVNFAGGEPLLNKYLGEYIKHAKMIGLKTSIITNASRMTMNWLRNYAPYIDQIGISNDSIDENVNKKLGRGGGTHVAITERAFERIRQINEELSLDIKLKLNTVITRLSVHEDWTDFIRKNHIDRWKVFKVLKIEGENDDTIGDLEISDCEFQSFLKRHNQVDVMVPENNDDMTSSYMMITPDGRFFQNTNGSYSKSSPILKIGVQEALEEVGFDIEKFRRRGGAYEL